jgi:hypothetical protein
MTPTVRITAEIPPSRRNACAERSLWRRRTGNSRTAIATTQAEFTNISMAPVEISVGWSAAAVSAIEAPPAPASINA